MTSFFNSNKAHYGATLNVEDLACTEAEFKAAKALQYDWRRLAPHVLVRYGLDQDPEPGMFLQFLVDPAMELFGQAKEILYPPANCYFQREPLVRGSLAQRIEKLKAAHAYMRVHYAEFPSWLASGCPLDTPEQQARATDIYYASITEHWQGKLRSTFLLDPDSYVYVKEANAVVGGRFTQVDIFCERNGLVVEVVREGRSSKEIIRGLRRR